MTIRIKRLAYSCWRRSRTLLIVIVMIRFITGMQLVGSGLRKMIGEKITREAGQGSVLFFLDGLLPLNIYWNWVGIVELIAAYLMMTQRLATLAALITLFIASNVGILGWSIGWGNATPQLLMFISAMCLTAWDYYRFKPLLVFRQEFSNEKEHVYPEPANSWHYAGFVIFLLSVTSFVLKEVFAALSEVIHRTNILLFFLLCVLSFIYDERRKQYH